MGWRGREGRSVGPTGVNNVKDSGGAAHSMTLPLSDHALAVVDLVVTGLVLLPLHSTTLTAPL